jgi:hypothetical protein
VDDCLRCATCLFSVLKEKSRTNSPAPFPCHVSFLSSSSNLAQDIFVDELTTLKRNDESLRVSVNFEKDKGSMLVQN